MFPCTVENWITLMKELFSEIRKHSTGVWTPKASKNEVRAIVTLFSVCKHFLDYDTGRK